MKTKDTNFSSRLRDLRKQRGLSTQQVAKLCGVADSTYREWEYGREIRGIRPYEALSQAYQVSLAELLLGERGRRSAIEADLKTLEKIIRELRTKI